MIYLLDTSICVAALRSRSGAVERLRALGPERAAVSAMTVAELWHGVLKSRAPEESGESVRRFLDPIAVFPFDAPEALQHAKSRRALEAVGQPIGERELIIAATALTHGLTVVTGNSREFEKVSGLKVESWAA